MRKKLELKAARPIRGGIPVRTKIRAGSASEALKSTAQNLSV
jgi:hypothetical protein